MNFYFIKQFLKIIDHYTEFIFSLDFSFLPWFYCLILVISKVLIIQIVHRSLINDILSRNHLFLNQKNTEVV